MSTIKFHSLSAGIWIILNFHTLQTTWSDGKPHFWSKDIDRIRRTRRHVESSTKGTKKSLSIDPRGSNMRQPGFVSGKWRENFQTITGSEMWQIQ